MALSNKTDKDKQLLIETQTHNTDINSNTYYNNKLSVQFTTKITFLVFKGFIFKECNQPQKNEEHLYSYDKVLFT